MCDTTRVRRGLLPGLAAIVAAALASAAPAIADRREREIAFQSGRGLDPATGLQRIYSMESDGSNVRPMLPEQFGNSFDAAWSPDGRRFAFTSILNPGYFEIHIARADGTQIERITTTGDVHDAGPAWFPRGDWLAFVSDRVESDPTSFGQFDVYITRLRPPYEAFNVTDNPGNDCGCYESIFAAPSVSPDGYRIAFTSDVAETGNFDVYVINRDGTGLRRLTTEAGIDAEPDWSPDGQTIAFNSERDGDAELYVMRRDGRGVTQVTRNNVVADTQPDWSPDGRRLAFTSDAGGNPDIWVIDANGKRPRRLTANPALDERPAWRPLREHDHDYHDHHDDE